MEALSVGYLPGMVQIANNLVKMSPPRNWKSTGGDDKKGVYNKVLTQLASDWRR